jgi:hypothetical protein
MKYMNDYDIAMARRAFADHPVLAPAVEIVANLRDWTNQNSDGWAYWPKPCRAAARLIELIERDGTWEARYGARDDATPEELKAALRPIKSFLTRQGVPHSEVLS